MQRVGRIAGWTLVAAIAGGLALGLAGCRTTPGGPQMQLDRYTYESTTWMPQTVTLVDTRTGEELWTAEVPVGQKLTLQFYTDRTDNSYLPDLMRWTTISSKITHRGLSNTMAVPSSLDRRVDVTLREAPEFAPEVSAGAGG